MTQTRARQGPFTIDGGRLGGFLFLALLLALVAAPILYVIYGSLRTGAPGATDAGFTLENWRTVYLSAPYLKALWNTLALSAIVSVLAPRLEVEETIEEETELIGEDGEPAEGAADEGDGGDGGDGGGKSRQKRRWRLLLDPSRSSAVSWRCSRRFRRRRLSTRGRGRGREGGEAGQGPPRRGGPPRRPDEGDDADADADDRQG